MQENNPKMEWLVLGLSGGLLFISVIISFLKPNTDTKSAYYLFGTVASFVFGATVIKKYKK